jgi:dTMP kinase
LQAKLLFFHPTRFTACRFVIMQINRRIAATARKMADHIQHFSSEQSSNTSRNNQALTRARGQFIVFEGIDGAGKSSYLPTAMAILEKAGKHPLLTREPGGTKLGEQLRALLLNEAMAPETECLLMFAARQQHVKEVIEPALAAGRWVLSDRFTDATYAYQGAGRGFSIEKIQALETWVQGDLRPDHVLLFDLDANEAQIRRGRARSADKFEQLDLTFFNKVRAAYHARAAQNRGAYHIIDTALTQDEVKVLVEKTMSSICI